MNGVVDQNARRNTASVANRAEDAGLPRAFVDIRHGSHQIPFIRVLQETQQVLCSFDYLRSPLRVSVSFASEGLGSFVTNTYFLSRFSTETSHNELPSLPLVRHASKQVLLPSVGCDTA